MSYIGNSPGVASQRVETAFTATSNQTAFTPSSGYTLGYCDVYQNGVKLVNGDDYTASDGVTVTLATGAASGDSIVIVASFPRGLSDGYLKSEADAKYVALTGAQTVAGVKTFSSQIVGIAGTAGAPAVTTTGDTDTGIFFPAANTLAFSTNGTEDARFDANGNFGIGTTSPSGRLHTAVADGATNALYAERTGASPVQFTVNFANQFSNLVSSSIMTFSTNGFTERARIDTSGNFGLGVTPSAWGSSYKAVQIGSLSGMSLMGYSGAAEFGNNFYFDTAYRYGATGTAARYVTSSSGHIWYTAPSGTAGNAITFTQAMMLDSNGNLGVGLTPASGGYGRIDTKQYASGDSYAVIQARSYASGGSDGSTSVVVTRAVSDTAAYWANAKYHAFSHTWGIGGSASASSAMTLDGGGRLLVGQTFSSHSTFQFESGGSGAKIGTVSLGRSGGDYPWIGFNFAFTGSSGNYVYAGGDYASSIYFYVGGIYTYTASSGTAGNAISWTGGPYVARGGTSWTNASDERLKNITGDIENGLAKVCALRAATYTWKHDDQNTPQVGLIAQNVLTVLPEAVVVPEEEFNGKPETSMGVNYDRLIPVLVAAIKEQQAIIEQLQADVATLKGTP